MGSSIARSYATWMISSASRRIVAAGMPQRSATASAAFDGSRNRSASSANTGFALRPSGNTCSPTTAGDTSIASAGAAPRSRVQHSGLPSASRANRPSSAVPGACTTSQCAFV